MKSGRVLVGVLGGVAAGFAMTVGAVSLTRIAGDYLGFPPGLEWTFTGSVDVAGIAGGIMWTAFAGQVRQIGRPMNVVCTVVSGVGVGLDHATHAGRALHNSATGSGVLGAAGSWPWIAFVAGLFVPALATWILHALSIIADTSDHQPVADNADSSPTTATSSATDTDRRATHIVVGAPPVATRNTTDSCDSSTTSRDHQLASAARSARALTAVPEARADRPDWMTADLIGRATTSMAAAQANGEKYGSPRLGKETGLNDWKSRALLAYIRDNDLVEESA